MIAEFLHQGLAFDPTLTIALYEFRKADATAAIAIPPIDVTHHTNIVMVNDVESK